MAFSANGKPRRQTMKRRNPVRPVWADFLIAALVFCAVLLPLEYGGDSAVVIAALVAAAFLLLLLLSRLRRRRQPR